MKRFNLMPKSTPYVSDISGSASTGSKDMELVIISIPIILALALVYFLYTKQQPDIKQEPVNPAQVTKLETLKKEYEVLLSSVQDNTNINKMIEERNRLRSNLDALNSLSLVRSIPLDLLIAIGRNISEKLALTEISKKDSFVTLEGISMDNKSLSEFMETLVAQNVFKNVNIKTTEYTDEFGPYKHKFVVAGTL